MQHTWAVVRSKNLQSTFPCLSSPLKHLQYWISAIKIELRRPFPPSGEVLLVVGGSVACSKHEVSAACKPPRSHCILIDEVSMNKETGRFPSSTRKTCQERSQATAQNTHPPRIITSVHMLEDVYRPCFMPSKKPKCASFRESKNVQGPSRPCPCHMISLLDIARRMGLLKQLQSWQTDAYCACMTSSYISPAK